MNVSQENLWITSRQSKTRSILVWCTGALRISTIFTAFSQVEIKNRIRAQTMNSKIPPQSPTSCRINYNSKTHPRTTTIILKWISKRAPHPQIVTLIRATAKISRSSSFLILRIVGPPLEHSPRLLMPMEILSVSVTNSTRITVDKSFLRSSSSLRTKTKTILKMRCNKSWTNLKGQLIKRRHTSKCWV